MKRYIVEAFTNQPFSGNPAVVYGSEGEMIARLMTYKQEPDATTVSRTDAVALSTRFFRDPLKLCIILLLVILQIAVSCTVGKAEAGAGEYAVVVSVNASLTEIYAAETLQEHLNLLLHSNYEIITDDRPFDGFAS